MSTTCTTFSSCRTSPCTACRRCCPLRISRWCASSAGHTGISVPSKAYGVLASGTPIIGILDPEGEIGQMIAETGCGVLVEPDGESIAEVIQELDDR